MAERSLGEKVAQGIGIGMVVVGSYWLATEYQRRQVPAPVTGPPTPDGSPGGFVPAVIATSTPESSPTPLPSPTPDRNKQDVLTGLRGEKIVLTDPQLLSIIQVEVKPYGSIPAMTDYVAVFGNIRPEDPDNPDVYGYVTGSECLFDLAREKEAIPDQTDQSAPQPQLGPDGNTRFTQWDLDKPLSLDNVRATISDPIGSSGRFLGLKGYSFGEARNVECSSLEIVDAGRGQIIENHLMRYWQ